MELGIDVSARTRIRDSALTLFAHHGPDAVTIRQIASHAGVSPALILHHYGSRAGLRTDVDAHVARVFDGLLVDSLSDAASLARADDGAVASLAEIMLQNLPPGSPIPEYFRRLILTGDPTGREFFRQWFAMSRTLLDALAGAGALRPASDPDVRTAFLMVNDLALVLLHDHLADVLGFDPLEPTGMRRWATDVLDAYTAGVFTPAPKEYS